MCECGSSTYSVEQHEVCTISDECFAVSTSYRRLARGRQAMADEEEELLQLAIQQSLLEGGASGEGEGGAERGRRESGVETIQEVRTSCYVYTLSYYVRY